MQIFSKISSLTEIASRNQKKTTKITKKWTDFFFFAALTRPIFKYMAAFTTQRSHLNYLHFYYLQIPFLLC